MYMCSKPVDPAATFGPDRTADGWETGGPDHPANTQLGTYKAAGHSTQPARQGKWHRLVCNAWSPKKKTRQSLMSTQPQRPLPPTVYTFSRSD